ncbi:hypothetical protein [Aeromonas hydrophila]|uniref:hypothetical protein n=1 Tax=Aeromonas hydrophila TaxID=644 RepID=UPI001269F17C|nr:hypothetical protein [Aeromonas hydrophila]
MKALLYPLLFSAFATTVVADEFGLDKCIDVNGLNYCATPTVEQSIALGVKPDDKTTALGADNARFTSNGAKAICKAAGRRVPTSDELLALSEQNVRRLWWPTNSVYWSSTPNDAGSSYLVVELSSPRVVKDGFNPFKPEKGNDSARYVSCVK